MIERPARSEGAGPLRVLAAWAGLILIVVLVAVGLDAVGLGFAGASKEWQLALVVTLLGAVALGITLMPGPPTRAAAGLVAGQPMPARVPAGVAPAAASVVLALLWLEPGPRPPEPAEDPPTTLIVRDERLRSPVVAGTSPVHLQVETLSRESNVPIVIEQPWESIPSTAGGISTGRSLAFAPTEPPDSPSTIWINVEETSWPLRIPPDRLEVDESTAQAQVDRLRASIDPPAGGMLVERHERGLALGMLVPEVRTAAPWREVAPITQFTTAGVRGLILDDEAWYRSAPRHHYVASYSWAKEQRSASAPSWAASDPPLAYPVIGHRVDLNFFQPPIPDVHVFYPLVSVATIDGLSEPYLVHVDPAAASTSAAGPDVLPDLEAPRQGRAFLDDLIFSNRSRVHSATPGFVVADRPAILWPAAAIDLPLWRRLPPPPEVEIKRRVHPLRLGLIAFACGLLIWSLWSWGRVAGR